MQQLKPWTVRDVLDNTWFAYRKNFGKILLYCLVFSGVFSIIYVVLQRLVLPSWALPFDAIFDGIREGDLGGIQMPIPDDDGTSTLIGMLLYYLVIFGKAIFDMIFIMPFIQGGITQLVSRSIHGVDMNFQDMVRYSGKNYGRFLLVQICRYLATLVMGMILSTVFSILWMAMSFGMIALMPSIANTFGSDGFGAILMVALVVLVVLLSIAVLLIGYAIMEGLLLFVYPVTVNENKRAFSAVFRSMSLAWKNKGKVIGTSLGLIVVVFLAETSLATLLGVISVFIPETTTFLMTAGELLSNLLVMPYMAIGVTLLYYNLRMRSEGYDLRLRLFDLQKKDRRLEG